MNSESIRRRMAGCLVLAALGACSKGGTDSPKAKAATTGAASAEGEANTRDGAVGAALSDANIFYVLDAVNMGDSAEGALAAVKGTSAEVRDFAKMMVRDHHTLRQLGQDLSGRLAIQPAPLAGDNLREKLDTAMSRLTAASKGRDFDKAYIDHEVAAHREVLMTVVASMSATQNSEIKNLIQKTAPIVQAHLDKAEAIQKILQK